MDTAADIVTKVRVEALDPVELSDADASPLAEVEEAGVRVDCPHEPALGAQQLRLRYRFGGDGSAWDHLAMARRGPAPVGYVAVAFAHWDNPTVAALHLVVHPDARDDDEVADVLMGHALAACRAGSRSQVVAHAWQDSWLAGYWERRGLSVASRDVERRIVVGDVDRARLDRLHADAVRSSPAYDVEVLPLPTPEASVDGVLDVHRAMNDAPREELALDDDVWSVERLVASESALMSRNLRVHRLIARRRADGVIGGWTELVVDPAQPEHGYQEDTAVVGEHRGHRLGLRLKSAMLLRLATEEPQLKHIDTWNAESNTHMIAVNDELGCVVVARGHTFQREVG